MKRPDELHKLRGHIDTITQQLVELLSQRAKVALEIGEAKKGSPVYDPAREAIVLAQIAANDPGPLSNTTLQAIFQEVIAACRNIQQLLRVAYLGPEGTYCQQAALRHHGAGCDFIPCTTIDMTIRSVEVGNADVAVVPVENSNEGSVTRTLDLLLETPLSIINEIALPIHHQLLARASTLAATTEVTAHPQALAQCQIWLDTYLSHATRTAAASNGAAAQVAAKNTTTAAIASVQAAELYNLPVVAKNIEDSPNNTTRFLVLGTTPTQSTDNDKTSLICSTPNQPGALHELLGIFAREGINMIKLESRPAAHTLWHYVFYIDIEGHQTDPDVARALSKLHTSANFSKVIGSYPKGII